MDTLTNEEREALAELKNTRGYQVLLRLFEKELEIIQDVLLHTTNPEMERHLTARWREFKRVYSTLKNTPEYLAQEMASADIAMMDENYSKEFDQKVFQVYRQKLKDEFFPTNPIDVN